MPAANGNAQGKRNLVRWDDDKDKQLLLSLQYVCANAGIRIPWDDIAKQMGPKYSGGACVQHLAKLRSRMEEEGVSVPPALARGLVTHKPSSVYGKSGGTRKRKALKDDEDDEAEVQPLNPAITPPPSKKRRSIKKEIGIKYESEEEKMPDLYDSDDDYMASSKSRKVSKSKPKPKRSAKKPAPRVASEEDIGEASASPESSSMRTRGNRVNYAQMELPVAEEDEEAPGVPSAVTQDQIQGVKTEESNITPVDSPTMVHQSSTTTRKEEFTHTLPLQQQMQAPGPYYNDFTGDFGGNYGNSFPGFNPSFTFSQPIQNMWPQANFSGPNMPMFGGQSQQQEKDAKVNNWLDQPTPQTQAQRTYNTFTQPFIQPSFDTGFNTGFSNDIFGTVPTTTKSFYKKGSVSKLKSTETSRNNSQISIDPPESLKAVPQHEGFQAHLAEFDAPMPTVFDEEMLALDPSEALFDWDAAGI